MEEAVRLIIQPAPLIIPAMLCQDQSGNENKPLVIVAFDLGVFVPLKDAVMIEAAGSIGLRLSSHAAESSSNLATEP